MLQLTLVLKPVFVQDAQSGSNNTQGPGAGATTPRTKRRHTPIMKSFSCTKKGQDWARTVLEA